MKLAHQLTRLGLRLENADVDIVPLRYWKTPRDDNCFVQIALVDDAGRQFNAMIAFEYEVKNDKLFEGA
jgi:hypothetical protein